MYNNGGRMFRSDCKGNSKNISPMAYCKVAQKNIISFNMILMGLGFRLKEGGNQEFVKDEAMSS